MTIYTIIGFVGVFLYLSSYFLLSLKKIDGNGSNYILMNLFGASCVVVSLIEEFNAPSFVIQITWIILSIIALIKIFFSKNEIIEAKEEIIEELEEVKEAIVQEIQDKAPQKK